MNFKRLSKTLTVVTLLIIVSCHQLEEDYSFNMYYNHKISNYSTIDENSDIPLALGLKAIDNEDRINFISNNGNIISTSYTSEKDLIKIKDFYTSTLPQLGWHISLNENQEDFSMLAFIRDNETLEIEFVENGIDKIVNFHAQLRV